MSKHTEIDNTLDKIQVKYPDFSTELGRAFKAAVEASPKMDNRLRPEVAEVVSTLLRFSEGEFSTPEVGEVKDWASSAISAIANYSARIAELDELASSGRDAKTTMELKESPYQRDRLPLRDFSALCRALFEGASVPSRSATEALEEEGPWRTLRLCRYEAVARLTGQSSPWAEMGYNAPFTGLDAEGLTLNYRSRNRNSALVSDTRGVRYQSESSGLDLSGRLTRPDDGDRNYDDRNYRMTWRVDFPDGVLGHPDNLIAQLKRLELEGYGGLADQIRRAGGMA